ncbi:uncharacterized protein Gasu_58630 [Galdieria sulphuraria]|uniref:Uncharacterized protein n=1 Tax=Galdieria sulphuraria TaxID=130081 RepID=M2WRS9_GALSU|nr:uncharacterized protein Gasu_58630 [Galdieria sulphuraria]EME26540.1 hypothetical protein Gasu_58630 [Galdieria sulphuraria]|eukprot:XP_005703060.1 hypothetical protein Gasu_58630 [Galdieria sulphuraria]
MQVSNGLRMIVESPQFRKSLRITIAAAAGNLFVFYSVFHNYIECFLGIYIYLVLVIVAQCEQLGGVIQAAIRFSYIAGLASVLAIIALGIAQGSGVALYFVALVEFFLVSLLRLDPKVRGYGISIFFLLGPTLMESVGLHLSQCWQTIYATLLSAVLAGVIAVIATVFIFPETIRSKLRSAIRNMSCQVEDIIQSLDTKLFTTPSYKPIRNDVTSYIEPTTNIDAITPMDKKQTPSFLQEAPHILLQLWRSLAAVFDDPTLRPLSVALDNGDFILKKCAIINATIRNSMRLCNFLYYEPTFFPPWQCEPRENWMPILQQWQQLVAHLESLNQVVRRNECFHTEYLSESFGIPVSSIRDALLYVKERMHQLKSFHSVSSSVQSHSEQVANHLFERIYEEFAKVREQMWKSEIFYEEKAVDHTFRYSALAFLVVELRATHESLHALEDAMQSFSIAYHEQRFSIAKNWLPMLDEFLLPFRGYTSVPVLIKDKDNFQYIIKFMLALAIIEFPPLFVAQFSDSAKSFMRNENDIYVLIYVAILFWQSKELSVFRSLLYFSITFVASALAYAATVFTPNHIYGLTLWLALWTFIGLLVGTCYPAYIMGTFPLALAQFGIISCDYNKYSFTYVASRTVCVCIACGVVFVFSTLIWPYSVALKCRKMLSNGLTQLGQLSQLEWQAFECVFMGHHSTPSLVKQKMHSIAGILSGVRMLVQVELTPNYRRSSIPTLVDVIGFCLRRYRIVTEIVDMKPLKENSTCDMYQVFTELVQHLENSIAHVSEIFLLASEHIIPPSKKRKKPVELLKYLTILRKDKEDILFAYVQGRQELFRQWHSQRLDKLAQRKDSLEHPFVTWK